MKNILYIVVFAVLSFQFSVSAQENRILPDERLFDVFDSTKIEQIMSLNPSLIEYYNFYLDNSFYVADLPEQKSDYLNNLQILDFPENDIFCINPLKFNSQKDFKLDFKKETHYRLGSTQKVIVFYSGEEINKKFNEHKGIESDDINRRAE